MTSRRTSLRPGPRCRRCSSAEGAPIERYTSTKLDADVATLRGAGVDVTICEFDGGHEWADAFVDAAVRWLADRT